MPEALRIFPGKRQKFILVRVTRDEEESLALWSNPEIEWHNDILKELERAGHTVTEMLGGGWLFLDPDAQSLYIWGKSDRFGPAPRSLIKELFKQELPESTLHIDQEP